MKTETNSLNIEVVVTEEQSDSGEAAEAWAMLRAVCVEVGKMAEDRLRLPIEQRAIWTRKMRRARDGS